MPGLSGHERVNMWSFVTGILDLGFEAGFLVNWLVEDERDLCQDLQGTIGGGIRCIGNVLIRTTPVTVLVDWTIADVLLVTLREVAIK